MPFGMSLRARPAAPSPSTSRPARGRGLVSSAVMAGLALAGAAVPAEASGTYSAPLSAAVDSLPVAAENNEGYDRQLYFGSWKDADKDCQNTRAEVLLEETRAATTFTTDKYCTVKTGMWVTTWDNLAHTEASDVQIDHMVPVHEVWGSGARDWTQERRVAFYNDLGDSRSLNAQTSSLNSAKQAKGPEEWMPPQNGCAYIGEWVAVKIRWELTVDTTEKGALLDLAASCPDVTLTVAKA